MKKALLLLSLLSLGSLNSCVIAVGVPREEWDDCEMQSCESCGADLVCEQCKAKQPKTTVKIVQ